MIITRVARVALRRQAITTTIIARPTPAYARSLSFFDLFRPQRVESTETKETETKTTETEVAKTKTSDTQATETQPVKKPPFDTVPVETPSIEDQLNKDEPAKDQSVEEEPNEEFKEKFKGRRGQGKSQKTQPADQPKQKGSYKSRHSSKWIHIITKRIRLLQERQRTKKDIPHSLWREIGRVNASVNQNWSRVYASSEGFLTPKEGVAGLTKQEVAWGDMDNMVSHVNNIMYNKYAEASRVNWIRGLAEYRKDNTEEEVQQYLQLMTPESVGLILRSIRTYFKFPVKFPDRVSVFHKINKPPEPGSDHFILEAIILSEYNCRVAARCTEDIVIYDYQEGKKSTLRPNQVRDLNRIYKRQPLNRETADKEIDAWMDRLTDIEMQLQNTPTPKSSRPSQGAESLGRVEGLRLKDIPLKHEDVVESAIDEALRTTGELEAEVNEESEISKEDTRDAEASEDLEIPNDLASKDAETSEGTEANKDLEVPKDAETSNDAAVPEGTKDAVSEFTEESKESKNPDAFKNAEVLEGTKESKESKDSEASKDMAPESPKESKESQDAPKV